MARGANEPILISGGGIGGLIAAYCLAHQGFPVRLFEQSAEFKEVGAGIQLGPTSSRCSRRSASRTRCSPTRTGRRRRKCATR